MARIHQTDLDGNTPATERVVSVGVDYNIAQGWTVYGGYKNDKVTGYPTGHSLATGLRWQF